MLTVGALARRFGLTRSTLLYYDRLGLLRSSARSPAGYRRYGPDDVRRMEAICTYRRAGLSLRAVARVLDGAPNALTGVLEQRLAELDEELLRVREQQRLIGELLQRPALLRRTRVIDKRTWVELLRASGFSDADMERWHVVFERDAPQRHRHFLELLGLPPDEIAAIRAWSKRGGQAHVEAPRRARRRRAL